MQKNQQGTSQESMEKQLGTSQECMSEKQQGTTQDCKQEWQHSSGGFRITKSFKKIELISAQKVLRDDPTWYKTQANNLLLITQNTW